jgi:GT2 family glycosyltransferase
MPTDDFDLIVATVGRTDELGCLLDSIAQQGQLVARIVIVDQNDDDRVAKVVSSRVPPPELVRVHTARGVSDARNVGTAIGDAAFVAWPDDDCAYPPRLLDHVRDQFARDAELDVLVGRVNDPAGPGMVASPSAARTLDKRNLWRYAAAPAFFARRAACERIGPWSTAFGPGGTTRWDAGEDTDWLIRAVQSGLTVRFDPNATVLHADPFLGSSREARHRARRYGRCTAVLALMHSYGMPFVLWLVLRAAGGAAVSLARGRSGLARIHAQAMIGRLEGAYWFTLARRRGEA